MAILRRVWAAGRRRGNFRSRIQATGAPYDELVRRAVLIVNPYSSRVTPGRVADVEYALSEGAEVVTRPTEAPGHATELAAEAARAGDAVVVFAGDGTYNEAINGAAVAVPFGFVPGGGTSVLPRALGLEAPPPPPPPPLAADGSRKSKAGVESSGSR